MPCRCPRRHHALTLTVKQHNCRLYEVRATRCHAGCWLLCGVRRGALVFDFALCVFFAPMLFCSRCHSDVRHTTLDDPQPMQAPTGRILVACGPPGPAVGGQDIQHWTDTGSQALSGATGRMMTMPHSLHHPVPMSPASPRPDAHGEAAQLPVVRGTRNAVSCRLLVAVWCPPRCPCV